MGCEPVGGHGVNPRPRSGLAEGNAIGLLLGAFVGCVVIGPINGIAGSDVGTSFSLGTPLDPPRGARLDRCELDERSRGRRERAGI